MKFLSVFILLFFLSACSLNNNDVDMPNPNYKISQVISIFVKNDSVCTSLATINRFGLKNEFYINDKSVTFKKMTEVLPIGRHIETVINHNYSNITLVKKGQEKLIDYRFYKANSFQPRYQLSYIKDGDYMQLDTVNKHPEIFGTLNAVYVRNGIEVFAGTFKKQMLSVTESGFVLKPSVPFVCVENRIKILPIPTNMIEEYNGINSVYLDETKSVYVTGKMSKPMYWINEQPIILSDKRGEVLEITNVGKTIFAVGYINKYDSKSINNTACYWRDGKIVELEEQAVATSIFVDGSDIYIGGATGRTPDDFQACYWKNGKKIMLK